VAVSLRRGVKHFSQRAQRLRSGRNVCPDNAGKTNAYFFFNQGHCKIPVLNSRINRC
jgi:hypothetical protein